MAEIIKLNLGRITGFVGVITACLALCYVPYRLLAVEKKANEISATVGVDSGRINKLEQLNAAQTEIMLRVERSLDRMNDKLDAHLSKP